LAWFNQFDILLFPWVKMNQIVWMLVVSLLSRIKAAVNTNVGYEQVLYNPGIFTSSSMLQTPITIPSSSGVLTADISVKHFRFTSEVFDFDTRAYCFLGTCSIPGPTLIVQQGDVVKLRLINSLGSTDNSKSNTTSIFLHGLRVDADKAGLYSRAVNHDDYTVLTFKIPIDHAPGTHWYHSNSPEAEALHVAGGLHGAIIVNPLVTSVIPASLLAMRRIVAVFSHIDLRSTIDAPVVVVNTADDPESLPSLDSVSTGNIGQQPSEELPNIAVTLPMLAALAGSRMNLNPTFHSVQHYESTSTQTSTTRTSIVKNAWLVNGQYQPKINLVANEWLILDLVAASGDRILELEIASGSIGHGFATELCAMRLLAIDGIYLSAPRGKPFSDHFPLLQGSRATIVVMCTSPGNYYLQSASVVDDGRENLPNYVRIGKPSTKSIQNLITLVVAPPNSLPVSTPPASLSSIPRPDYLTDLRLKSLSSSASKWSVSVDQRGCCTQGASVDSPDVPLEATTSPYQPSHWVGVGRDCTLTCFSNDECKQFYGSNYSVFHSPTVQLKKCAYVPNASPVPTDTNNALLSASVVSRVSIVNRTEEIDIWSPKHFVSNIQFISQHVQIVAYSSLGYGGENVQYGPYRVLTTKISLCFMGNLVIGEILFLF